MAERKLYSFKGKKNIKGIYHEYKTDSGKSTRLNLCTFDEARYKDFPNNKRLRCRCKIRHFENHELEQCGYVYQFLQSRYFDLEDTLRKKQIETTITENNRITAESPVSKLIQKYLEECRLYNSESTLNGYRSALKYFSQVYSDRTFSVSEDVSRSRIYQHLKNAGIADSSAVLYLNNIGTFFNWLYESRIVKQKIPYFGRLPKLTKPLKVAYTDDLLNELEDRFVFITENGLDHRIRRSAEICHRFIIMARFTALRCGEIWSMKLDRIKNVIEVVNVNEIGFRVKDYEERKVPICDDLNDYLDRIKRTDSEIWYQDDGYGNQHYRRKASSSDHIKTVLKKEMNVTDLRPMHSIRAYAITRMIAGGMNLHSVKNIAGHEHLSTTQQYIPDHMTYIDNSIQALNRDFDVQIMSETRLN